MKLLVTGGCGFIGSNFILRCFEKENDISIINVDALKDGSNLANLKNCNNKLYSFVKGDINNKKLMEKLIQKVDCIINFAAESHVDRSIENSIPFIKSNILGVHNILEILKKYKKVKFLQISTDEVFGEILHGKFSEDAAMNPSNPYAATKASAEMLVKAYSRTYNLDTIITRSVNNYGPRQFPEKLIPKTIISIIKNKKIPIHGNGKAKRQWIHVNDNCDAIFKIIKKWKHGQIYNIPGNYESSNLKLVQKILKSMNGSENLINFVSDRPGQDRRYGIESNFLKNNSKFKPKIDSKEGIESTISWYIENKEWWKNLAFKNISNPTPWKAK
jgi:dTDP-glucose 4,6-dehydratase